MAWQQLDKVYLEAGFTEKELEAIKKKIRHGDMVKTYKRAAAEMDCGDEVMDNGKRKRIEMNIEDTKTQYHFIIEYHACVNSGVAFFCAIKKMMSSIDWLTPDKYVFSFFTTITAQGTYKITVNWVVRFAKRFYQSQYKQKIRNALFPKEKVGKLGCGSVAMESYAIPCKVEWDNLVATVEKEANGEGNHTLSVWGIQPFSRL
jgi:hypothetical protein